MNFHFDSKIAELHGVDEAIMLENLQFWILKNKANGTHFYDGEYWTYNSVRAFNIIFPFWTQRQIERILKSLLEQNLIKDGNYNKATYDKTKWYCLTDYSKSLYAFGEMDSTKNVKDSTKRGNGFHQNVEPIPDNKPNNKLQIVNTYTNNLNLITTLNDYIDMRKNIKSSMTPRAIELMLNKLDELAKDDDTKILILNQSIMNSWKGIFPLKTDQQAKPQPQKQPTNQGSKREYSTEELEDMTYNKKTIVLVDSCTQCVTYRNGKCMIGKTSSECENIRR